LSPIDQELARILRKSRKPVVVVMNKIDNDKQENLAADFASLGFSHSQPVSAEHNRGIAELIETIDQLLPSPSAVNQSPVNRLQSLSVAIIGRPNVGKSSLINAIVRSERAIVSELPGTTRDAIDISYRRDDCEFLFIDTAGIRRRGKHSTSAEVFSVMRAERSIRRAHLCILIVDLTMGVTAQDKRIAGMIQRARKAAIIVLNKWDLIKPRRKTKETITQLVDETGTGIFFLDYAPVLVASAQTGESIDKLFGFIANVRRAAQQRIGTGVLNRLLRAAFAANPPPMISGKRLKLLYAAQAGGKQDRELQPPEFVLFVNDPRLLGETYSRYLEARIRKAQPFPGLPIILTLRPRSENAAQLSRAFRLRAK
jgi:GTPase